MTTPEQPGHCEHTELVAEYALDALEPSAREALSAHVRQCETCRRELEQLQEVVDTFVAWPTDVLRPSASLQARLAQRIARDGSEGPEFPESRTWHEPEWKEVSPGIFCKLLARDAERDRLTMLVRLLPGVSYPPHTHAGVEELHLLEGELWINDRLLHPGDYNYGEPGGTDFRVHSETGCTCVLITSPSDVLL